jgi:hypothetical protein
MSFRHVAGEVVSCRRDEREKRVFAFSSANQLGNRRLFSQLSSNSNSRARLIGSTEKSLRFDQNFANCERAESSKGVQKEELDRASKTKRKGKRKNLREEAQSRKENKLGE